MCYTQHKRKTQFTHEDAAIPNSEGDRPPSEALVLKSNDVKEDGQQDGKEEKEEKEEEEEEDERGTRNIIMYINNYYR